MLRTEPKVNYSGTTQGCTVQAMAVFYMCSSGDIVKVHCGEAVALSSLIPFSAIPACSVLRCLYFKLGIHLEIEFARYVSATFLNAQKYILEVIDPLDGGRYINNK